MVAIGKAAHAMLDGLRAVFAARLFLRRHCLRAGCARRIRTPALQYFVGGHPIPNEESWKAAKAILEMLADCDEQTLIFFLLSGGGSALVELPLDPRLYLADVQQIHRALVGCGASIEDINAVRKHISAVKGGRLGCCGDVTPRKLHWP